MLTPRGVTPPTRHRRTDGWWKRALDYLIGLCLVDKQWRRYVVVCSWLAVTAAPILLEAYFLRWNYEAMVRPAQWFLLAPDKIVVFLPMETRPRRLRHNNTWVIDFVLDAATPPAAGVADITTVTQETTSLPHVKCQRLQYASVGTSQTTWELTRPHSVEPHAITTHLLGAMVLVRWFFPFLRLFYRSQCANVTCLHVVLDLVLYVALCVMSLALLGTEMHPGGCIEWWAFGTYGAEAFERQLGYWAINIIAVGVFWGATMAVTVWQRGLRYWTRASHDQRSGHVRGAAALTAVSFTRPTDASFPTPPDGRRGGEHHSSNDDVPQRGSRMVVSPVDDDALSDPCCPTGAGLYPLWPVGMFFFGSAFLPSSVVLVLGASKPWILAIWLSLFLIALEGGLRRCIQWRTAVSGTAVVALPASTSGTATADVAAVPWCDPRGWRDPLRHVEDAGMSDLDGDDDDDDDAHKQTCHDVPRKRDEVVFLLPIAREASVFRVQDSPVTKTNDSVEVVSSESSPPPEEALCDGRVTRSPTTVMSNATPDAPRAGGLVCSVCLEQPVEIVASPCHHGVLCRMCCRGLLLQGIATFNHHVQLFHAMQGAGLGGVCPSLAECIQCPLCRSSTTRCYQFYPANNVEGRAVCVWDIRSVKYCHSARLSQRGRRVMM